MKDLENWRFEREPFVNPCLNSLLAQTALTWFYWPPLHPNWLKMSFPCATICFILQLRLVKSWDCDWLRLSLRVSIVLKTTSAWVHHSRLFTAERKLEASLFFIASPSGRNAPTTRSKKGRTHQKCGTKNKYCRMPTTQKPRWELQRIFPMTLGSFKAWLN